VTKLDVEHPRSPVEETHPPIEPANVPAWVSDSAGQSSNSKMRVTDWRLKLPYSRIKPASLSLEFAKKFAARCGKMAVNSFSKRLWRPSSR